MPDPNRPTEFWHKSSFSTINECVEVGDIGDGRIGIRNSKSPRAGVVHLTRSEMDTFLSRIQEGGLDHLA